MRNLQHEWSKTELTIAYYLAKWDYTGLGISAEDIVDSVIPETTVHSLNMQTANFRYLLNIDGYKLSDASKLMKEIIGKYQNSTREMVRKLVLKSIQKCDLMVGRNLRSNRKIEEKKDVLNRELQERFEAKLLDYRKGGKRLIPLRMVA